MRGITWWLTVAFSVFATAANAQNFSNSFFFGDSLTDSGWFLYKPLGNPPRFGLAPPGAGTWTTNPDPGWAQIFANKFGATATPSDTPGVGGNNYAIGGARVVAQNGNILSTQTQIATYLTNTGGVADPNAIYTFWAGSNDLKTTTVASGSSPGNIVDPQNIPLLMAVAGQAAGGRPGRAALERRRAVYSGSQYAVRERGGGRPLWRRLQPHTRRLPRPL